MLLRVLSAALAAMALVSAAYAQPPTAPPAPPQGATPDQLLATVAAHSRHAAALDNGRLAGEGADFLRTLTADAQFVLLGEDHGNAGIADFATALWRDLNAAGRRYAAVEIDPWVAAALERELRAGGAESWTRFLAPRGGAIAAPFFTWTHETRFAEAVLAGRDTREAPALWGLDQVFIGAAPWLLRRVAEEARNPEARALAAELAAASAGDLQWLGRSEEAQLRRLRGLLSARRDAELAELVDAMLLSQQIYRPFTGGGGEAYLANGEREHLMRRNFLRYYEEAMRRDHAPPRVLFKFGANHMYRGATPTMVQGLGGFVTEYATLHGRTAISILAVCGPGSSTAGLIGPATPCDQGFSENFGFLAPFVERDRLTLFDLRVWRMRPRRWEHLPAAARSALASFDVLVVIPGAPAQAFLPGLPSPQPPPN